MVQLLIFNTDLDYTIIGWLLYYSIWIHHECGYRRYFLLAYESYYVWCAALRLVQQYLRHSPVLGIILGGKALGTIERITSCAHV